MGILDAPGYSAREAERALFQSFSMVKKRTGVLIGNSLMAGTNTNNAMSFGQQLQARIPELFKTLRNAAVGGRSSAVILANLPTDVLATDEFGIYHEGTNDAYGTTQVTANQHLLNIQTIHRYFLSRGKAFAIIETATVDLGLGGTTAAAARALMEKYALGERFYCEDNGIMFSSPWWEFIDTTTGGFTATATVADLIHPPQAVHDKASINTVDQWRTRRLPPLMPRCNLGSGGLSGSNVLNLTGTGLTGWSTTGAVPTTSAVSTATSPVRGNWSDQVVTGLTASGKIYRYLNLVNIAEGDRIRIAGFFKFTNTSNMRFAVRLNFQRSVAPNTSLYLFDTSTSFGETYFEAEIIAPSNITNAILWIEYQAVTGGTNAYSGSFSWAGFDAYNVTKLLAT